MVGKYEREYVDHRQETAAMEKSKYADKMRERVEVAPSTSTDLQEICQTIAHDEAESLSSELAAHVKKRRHVQEFNMRTAICINRLEVCDIKDDVYFDEL